MRDVDIIELRAFIGLLFYIAVLKSSHESIQSLFAMDSTGRDIFHCIMNERFSILM
jgi:hypothetical protein